MAIEINLVLPKKMTPEEFRDKICSHLQGSKIFKENEIIVSDPKDGYIPVSFGFDASNAEDFIIYCDRCDYLKK